MAESSRDAEKHESKKARMRRSLRSSFDDHLTEFTTPESLRNLSESIRDRSAKLEARGRQISSSSDEPVGDDPHRITTRLDQREEFISDLDTHCRDMRTELREKPGNHRKEYGELGKLDVKVLKEKRVLSTDRMRVKHSIESQPSNVKFGQAYMIAITESLPEPAEASYKKMQGRSNNDQSSFRRRLIKAYNTEGPELLERLDKGDQSDLFMVPGPNKIWCPIAEKAFDLRDMKAAHIIPYAIGEANAAYIYGSKISEGYQHIWSEGNGLMMHAAFERIFDDGRMVIKPDPSDKNEFICIILSEELLQDNRLCPATETPYHTIHRKRLRFQTAARPSKKYFYLHALLTLFRRRRFAAPGWEEDIDQVFNGQIWATPGKWARRSMIHELAFEVGDIWQPELEQTGGLTEFPNTLPEEDEKKIATVVRYAFDKRGSEAGIQ